MTSPLVLAGIFLAIGAGLLLWPSKALMPSGRRVVSASAARMTAPSRFILWIRSSAVGSRRAIAAGWGLIAGMALVGVSIATGIAAAVLVSGLVYLVFDVLQSRQSKADFNRDIEGLRAIAAELRSGQSIDAALAAAAPISCEATARRYRAAASAVQFGADAIPGLTGGSAIPQSIGRVWKLASATGCQIADPVANLEADAQSQRQHNRDIDSLLAGPNATAALLAMLPIFGLIMGTSIGADPLRILTSTQIGSIALIVGTALTVAGILWTRAIVTNARGSS